MYFWVCNEDDEFAECLKIGANGIMTDYPTKLKKFLATQSALITKVNEGEEENVFDASDTSDQTPLA